jgi:hypothetical protein
MDPDCHAQANCVQWPPTWGAAWLVRRPLKMNCSYHPFSAGVAQLVEQLICNQPVVGSNPIASSILFYTRSRSFRDCSFFHA